MPTTTKLFGSAGTGKTTFIYRKILSKLTDEDVKRVVALSFTVAAKKALLSKEKRLDEKQVRTIHSIAFSMLGYSPQDLVTPNQIKKFFDAKNIPYKPDDVYDDDLSSKENLGNTLLKWWGRLYNEAPKYLNDDGKINLRQFIIDNQETMIKIGIKTFVDFVRDYKAYLKELGKFDFNQILFQAYLRADGIQGSYLILDEAQDLSPLMIGILQKSWNNFEHVVIAGDDDQTIYSPLNGANAELLLDLKADNEIVLNKSWRLPKRVMDLSKLILKNITRRKEKIVEPRNAEGFVGIVNELPEDVGKEPYFILVRHRKDVVRIRKLLNRMNVPHSVLGQSIEKDVWLRDALSALMLYKRIKQKEGEITSTMVKNFFNLLPKRFRRACFKATEWEEVKDDFIFNRNYNFFKEKYPLLVELIENFSPISIFYSKEAKRLEVWYKRLDKLEEWLNPKVVIGTIHQAKGLESKNVIVYLGVNQYTYQNLRTDYERRVWYVAVTRASERLYLLMPPSSQTFNEELYWLAQMV